MERPNKAVQAKKKQKKGNKQYKNIIQSTQYIPNIDINTE